MTTDIEKSFKAKLRNIAREVNRNPADLWQAIVLERFLVRLGQSPHRNHFALKGGLLLAKYIPIGRETQDIDLLGLNISNNTQQLKTAFAEIVAVEIKDGFIFQELTIKELLHPHMAYTGMEVSMMAHFGKTRFPVSIDIGFGDVVKPVEKNISLTHHAKGPLFEETTILLCYPLEFIFAEKLETLVYRGGSNSRMKDFHDLYTMLKMPDLSHDALKTIIPTVFANRETTFNQPLLFSDADISSLQLHWTSYLTRLRPQDAGALPTKISDCIHVLNQWLVAII